MARRLGLPFHAVQAYLQRQGIGAARPRGASPVIDPVHLRRLIEVERRTQQEAAETLGCSVSAVERTCRRLRLETARTGPRAGASHPDWSGGRVLAKAGYIDVYAPLHPHAKSTTSRVAEHRLMMEAILGRYLEPGEVVDHIDNHPQHNWPGNLRVFASNTDHLRATLTGLPQASPRRSIDDAHPSSRKTRRCPSQDETLAGCPSEIRRRFEHHVLIHRPTPEQVHLPRRELLRSGPWSPPFR